MRNNKVMLGMVLPHLREPFHALAQTTRLSRDAVIITQQAPKMPGPFACFIPKASMDPTSVAAYNSWWVFSEDCLREMLQVLGFRIESVTYKKHLCTGRTPAAPEDCTPQLTQ